jgi:hypothetical protein
MHTEYDGAKLSEERLAGIFSSLEADVRAANRQLPVRRAQSVSWTQRLTGALRQAVAGPTVSRLAPGAVALALVLSVVGPNMANVLRGEPSSLYSMTLSTPTPEVVDAGAIVTEREKVDLANTRPASPAYEAQALDPYEMHILQRSRTQSQPGAGDSPAVDPFYYQRSGFGPQ